MSLLWKTAFCFIPIPSSSHKFFCVVYPEHPVSAKARTKEIDVEKLAPQTKKPLMADAGWKLIGTMVAEPAEKSIAVIRYLRTQIQDTVKRGRSRRRSAHQKNHARPDPRRHRR